MDRYIEFNPLKFLGESTGWAGEIKSQEKKLDAVLELRGQSESNGRAGGISNPTESINLEKADIEAEIERLKYYQQVFGYAWEHLTEEERTMINGFFFRKYGRVREFVNKYAVEHNTNTSYVYNARKDALRKFTMIVSETFIKG